MVSNTGSRSQGERLMTLSTSAVAVCCSSASASSSVRCLLGLEQPHVLDRDHRLVGEGFDQFDLLRRVNGFTTGRVSVNTPIGTPSLSNGTPRLVR